MIINNGNHHISKFGIGMGIAFTLFILFFIILSFFMISTSAAKYKGVMYLSVIILSILLGVLGYRFTLEEVLEVLKIK
jgi:hypothetical protein